MSETQRAAVAAAMQRYEVMKDDSARIQARGRLLLDKVTEHVVQRASHRMKLNKMRRISLQSRHYRSNVDHVAQAVPISPALASKILIRTTKTYAELKKMHKVRRDHARALADHKEEQEQFTTDTKAFMDHLTAILGQLDLEQAANSKNGPAGAGIGAEVESTSSDWA